MYLKGLVLKYLDGFIANYKMFTTSTETVILCFISEGKKDNNPKRASRASKYNTSDNYLSSECAIKGRLPSKTHKIFFGHNQGSHFSGLTKFPDFSLTFPVFFPFFQYFFRSLFFLTENLVHFSKIIHS